MNKRSLIAIVALLAFGRVALATEPPSQDAPATTADVLTDKRSVVAHTMGLSPEMAQRFWPLYDDYQVQVSKLNEDRKAVLYKFSVNYINMSNELAQELIDKTLTLEKKRYALRKELVAKFSKQFPPKVVARYYQIENKIDAMALAAAAENVPLLK